MSIDYHVDGSVHREVGPKVDVWALGCLLYVLCYGTHPFADASALQIGQAKWALPAGGTKRPASYRASAAEIELLHLLLQRDPRCRPTATALRTG